MLQAITLFHFAGASIAFNAWGWAYNNGAAISKERRINIVTQMLITGGNVLATAMFVKCSQNTVTKWWKRWQATGEVEVGKGRRGPAPVLDPAALLYLLCLSEIRRHWTLAQYQQNLRSMIGVEASERVICAALKKLGQHRKAASIKKVEGLAPHARLLRQRYFTALFGYRLARGPGHIHFYFFIDEMYLDFDDTKAKKARAANGEAAVVVDFDTRGHKWGQLAAVCTGGLCAQFVYPCNYRSTTRDLFEWWIVCFLMPVLPPGSIVVMDRAKFHDPLRTASFLRLKGCGLLMLGPYQSQDNAIEYMHHVEKCYLRRDVDFTRAAPDVALYQAGAMITPVQATNTIRHVIGF